MSARAGRALVRAAWTLAVALAGVLVLKLFVCDVKHVDSGSMAPTILGSLENGESVLVLYGPFEPERFDHVVITREGDPVPIVKRIVGLPTESVRIGNGDLLIDGRRLSSQASRPPPIPVFDDRFQSVSVSFERARDAENRWTEKAGEWALDASDLAPASAQGLMSLHRPLLDGYLDPDGAYVPGVNDVNDAVFECEVLAHEVAGRAVVELVEQGDVFRFVFEPKSSGTAEATIVRASAADPAEILASRVVPFVPGAWTRLRCSNIDNGLAFEVSGSPEVLCAEYTENRFDEADRLKEGKSFGPRVRFGGEGGRLGFRRIRVLRDLYYTARDNYGVKAPADLGPDEFFVLGDNSAESRDSREWGPVRRSRIIGRPTWVVWPPAHARALVTAVAGACGR